MSDIKKLLNMNYDEVVEFLLKKYGNVKKNYFATPEFKSKSVGISRTKEGLVIHHIDEDKAIMLSQKEFAILYPYEYQLANRLVYCNLLEHLVLHIKIVEYPKPVSRNEKCGVGGIVNFLVPELNDIYSGIQYKNDWQKNLVNPIINDFEDYILCMKKINEMNLGYNLLTSFSHEYGVWNIENNKPVFDELKKIGIKN